MKGFFDQFLPALIAGLVVLIVGTAIQFYTSQRPSVSGSLFFNKSEISFSGIREYTNNITRRSAIIYDIFNLDETPLGEFEIVFTGIRVNPNEYFDVMVQTQDALLKNEVSEASVDQNGYLRVRFQRMGENGQLTIKFLSDYSQQINLESATDGVDVKQINRFTVQSRVEEGGVGYIIIVVLTVLTSILYMIGSLLFAWKERDE